MTTVAETPLSARLRALKARFPQHDGEIEARAADLDAVGNAWRSGKVGPAAVCSAWAKARRLYCDITGEELIDGRG